MSEKLPSLDDFTESELPSVEEFLKEEETVELPSVEEFVEEEVEEDSITIEDANGDPFLEVTDVVKAPEWSELVRMVNDVRESIPDIPQVKYYDDELKQLSEQIEEVQRNIPEVPEVKYYDDEIKSIKEDLNEKSNIRNNYSLRHAGIGCRLYVSFNELIRNEIFHRRTIHCSSCNGSHF